MRKIMLQMTVTLSLIFVMTACGTFRRMNLPETSDRSSVESTDYGIRKIKPKSYAVYPFKNTAFASDAGQRARRAVAAEFSLLGECKSLAAVDQIANPVNTYADAVNVGRQLGVDAVVVGEATGEDHFFALFINGTFVGLNVSVYSTRDGKLLWKGATSEYAIVGNPLIFPSVMSNLNRKQVADDLFHRMSADMVYAINPAVFSPALPRVNVK